MRRRRGRRIAAVVLVVVLLVAAVLAILLSGGGYDSVRRVALIGARQQAVAPAWSRPCWSNAPYSDKPFCVRVAGRVVWIQKKDPDGDGDRHLIVMSRLRPHIIKLSRDLPPVRLPRIGSEVEAVGWVELGASGHAEVNALDYDAGDVHAVSRRAHPPRRPG
jgi:hypothetical protein